MGWELRKRLLIEKPSLTPGRWVWVHCASVGELITAEPLIGELKRRFKVFLTYFSPRSRSFFLNRKDLWDAVFPLPLDLQPLVRKLEKEVRPKALLIVEREMWPSLIACTEAKKILVNARFKGDPLERALVRRYSLIVARTERDREGFRRFGARKVVACGNLKLLQGSAPPKGIEVPGRVLVAGSTHPGEEEVLLEAFLRLRRRLPLRMIIAPRHMERVREVLEKVRSKGVRWCLRTSPSEDWEVMVLDTLGELRGFYAAGEIAFVGGTLVPVGGHNLLEPALLGKPVLFGPYTQKVRDLREILLEEGYGYEVRGPRDIEEVVLRILGGGFRPRSDLRQRATEVGRCYLEAVLSELE
jgi:3-deoxy-D-manno-octulosonic-acid transferase